MINTSATTNWLSLLSALLVLTAAARAIADTRTEIDYSRDVRPILAENCYACHGPDAAVREAGLRLDQYEGATLRLESGHRAVVPGDPSSSELVRRVTSEDADFRMPPLESEKRLTDHEQQILSQWIAAGAQFDVHWAFVAPQRRRPPVVQAESWIRNEIDRFVQARLEQHEISHAPPAKRRALLRRLSLDLCGLPPTVEQLDRFLADNSPRAYESAVERLLSSPHFGEKLAQDWLDLARYGDTNGYHNDSHRDMWLFRDWVIHAFNTNMPFDRFVIEQIAGDLLPEATPAQQIASAFNRNAAFNEEGGADPAEGYVIYAIDRTNTTGQALMGLTVGCAQCHSHKYDPISHKEYYQLLAFFNSIEGEIGGGGENGHHGKPVPPVLKAVSPLSGQESTVMVMKSMQQRRPTFVLTRGDYQQPAEQVEPNVPAIFPPLRSDLPRDRRALAAWLVEPDHPLVSRVRVNHLWKSLFGTGLVRTAGDFGTQGSLPSHPNLLDWLAVEFIENGWDTKGLLKKIVMSATYRQQSLRKEVARVDPENRLLYRMPRRRMAAEQIRDMALAASGLLNRTVGGPSVRPYQPEGHFAGKTARKWEPSTGADLYRRGLYTYLQRTAPYPSFAVFDAPSRQICTARRPRTNTPLQALVTMNDPVYVEAARALAEEILTRGGESDQQRIEALFQRVLSRPPAAEEAELLTQVVGQQTEIYYQDESLAAQLVAVGEHPRNPKLDVRQLAAWTNVAAVVLNLDEAISHE